MSCLAAALTVGCQGPPSPGGRTDARPVADARIQPTEPDASLGTPDLTVSADRATVDLAISRKTFAPNSCELYVDESCVLSPGERTLLHFAIETPNIGTGDLIIGPPQDGNPNLDYSECHDHFHYNGYAAYRLLDSDSGEVAVGRKQAFCLLDGRRWLTDDDSVERAPRYTCDDQGLQRGWSDVYDTSLPCQFIDVTGVPEGDYTLEITINQSRTLSELDYDNNVVTIPIALGAPELKTPTEPCADHLEPRTTTGAHRECGWTQVGEIHACTPGEEVKIGCSSGCGEQSCGGAPMVRVCDGARADGNCSYPGALAPRFPAFPTSCPCQRYECPESGEVVIYVAPTEVGDDFLCDAAVIEP